MSTKNIEDILREAAAAVEAAGLPDDLRSAAFAKAVDLIAGAGGPSTPQATSTAVAEPGRTRDDHGLLSMIAERFGIDAELVNEALAIEDGEPSLVVARTKLANTDQGAAKQIALLIAAARQAAGVEDWTDASVIREAVTSYNRFDTNNFAKALNSLEDDFSFSGKGQARRVRVRRDGFRNAGAFGPATRRSGRWMNPCPTGCWRRSRTWISECGTLLQTRILR